MRVSATGTQLRTFRRAKKLAVVGVFWGEYDGYILEAAKSEIWGKVETEIDSATDKRKTRLLKTYKSVIPK